MANDINNTLINFMLNSLCKRLTVPSDFHGQAQAIKRLMEDDASGLIDSLTDFQVNAANVNWYIKTGNDNLDAIMERWLDTINIEYNGRIPSGIKPLATEYFKERWKGASFPILKILEWGEIDGFSLPMKMSFVDGANVWTENKQNDFIEVGEQEYYLGNKFDAAHRLDKGCIITKPFGRWHDEYPKIYLIKNGVYHNSELLKSLKNKQAEVLEQILPYLMLIQKGSEALAINKGVNYDDAKLQGVVKQMEELISKMNGAGIEGRKRGKTPIRATQFDEEIKHLIPDLKTILSAELSTGFEKGILTGLGFIDIAEAVSSSRKESVLNPKAFIQEINTGIGNSQSGSGFAQVLKDLMYQVKKQNEGRIKYNSLKFNIFHSKPQIFIDKDFRDFLLSLYNRGALSKKTLVEVAGDEIYDEQVSERKREAKNGDDVTMYPPITQSQEQQTADPEKDMKTTQEKLGPDAKQKYNTQ
jgi:hypothetical protein